MGIYTRKEFRWWLWLERAGQPGLRERTGIPHDAPTASERKRLRELAEDAYWVRMAALARRTYDLPGARLSIALAGYPDGTRPTSPRTRRAPVRESEILNQRRGAFAGPPWPRSA